MQAYKENSIELNMDYVFYSFPSLKDGNDLMMQCYEKFYLDDTKRFTGIMTFCDTMAFGVYTAAQKLGLNIPNDISVIGYDDSAVDALFSPPLTTIHMPKERVTSHCSELLISRLVKNINKISAITLEPHLVERESVKKI